MMTVRVVAALILAVTLTASYPIYQDRVPNAGQVPHPCKPNYLWRGVGHTNPLGGGPRNSFGNDFLRHGARWNQALCQADSDGDGLTNGQELGDPDCTWTQGNLPSRTVNITHPGVCDPWETAECRASNQWVDCEVNTLQCPHIQNNPDIENITIRFPSTSVPSTETNYICMTFDLPGDDVYHLVATEAYIDNAQVMHHILLHSCEDARELPTIDTPTSCDMGNPLCSSIISTWTVGHAGDCLPSQAGYRFGRGFFTRVVMEVHWNNPELRSDYTDSSGLTLYYTRQLRPNNAATLMVGQTRLKIPPQQPSVTITADMPGTCTRQLMTRPFYVYAAVNHMHYMGKSQKMELFRNGQLVDTITNEEVYSYDNPTTMHHDPAVEFRPGDELRTTCVYNSMYRNTTVRFGLATSDEMCFGFLMVYPAEAVPYLKQFINHGQRAVCDWTNIPQHHDNETTPTGNPPTRRPRPTSGSGSDTSGRTTPAAGWLEGCNTYEFTDTNRPTFQLLLGRLAQSCSAFGSCHHECRALMDEMADEPCLHGSAWRAVVGQLSRSHEGLMMVAYINSCPICPRCQSCGPV